jgi:multiple sugar transport system ATP-binding protein
MNMVEARLERSNGGWSVAFGDGRLAVDDEAVANRPALQAFEGRDVIVGIRPEDLEDAALVDGADPDRRLTATAELVEAMGSDVFVHFTIDATPVVTEETRELAEDMDEAGDVAPPGSRFVARCGPRTEARAKERIDLAVDTSRFHFFDPDTGRTITSIENTKETP